MMYEEDHQSRRFARPSTERKVKIDRFRLTNRWLYQLDWSTGPLIITSCMASLITHSHSPFAIPYQYCSEDCISELSPLAWGWHFKMQIQSSSRLHASSIFNDLPYCLYLPSSLTSIAYFALRAPDGLTITRSHATSRIGNCRFCFVALTQVFPLTGSVVFLLLDDDAGRPSRIKYAAILPYVGTMYS